MVRVFLFERTMSWFSWLISFVTNSKWTHAAIEINGKLYDASEHIGYVSERNPIGSWGKRRVRVFTLHTNAPYLEAWVQGQLGKKYDYVGIFGWLWAVHNQRRFYCFEFVWRALAVVQIVPISNGKLSGDDINAALNKHPYVDAEARECQLQS